MASLLPLLLLGGMMWFLLIRPQQQRVRRQQSLLEALQEGDEVITAGGMIGRVRALRGDRIDIELAPGVVLEFLRGAVSQRIVDEPDNGNADDTVVLDDDDR